MKERNIFHEKMEAANYFKNKNKLKKKGKKEGKVPENSKTNDLKIIFETHAYYFTHCLTC